MESWTKPKENKFCLGEQDKQNIYGLELGRVKVFVGRTWTKIFISKLQVLGNTALPLSHT